MPPARLHMYEKLQRRTVKKTLLKNKGFGDYSHVDRPLKTSQTNDRYVLAANMSCLTAAPCSDHVWGRETEIERDRAIERALEREREHG